MEAQGSVLKPQLFINYSFTWIKQSNYTVGKFEDTEIIGWQIKNKLQSEIGCLKSGQEMADSETCSYPL